MTEGRVRGDGRIFQRGAKWWVSFYVDGREQRESAKTSDEDKARKYLQKCLKRVHAHEEDPSKQFLTQRDRRRTIADLMDALRTNFELRGKASPQNLSNIRRVKHDFGNTRATMLSAETIADYIRDQLASGYRKATVNRWTEILRQGYSLAALPAPKIVNLDETDNVRRGFFSQDEIRALIANLPADLADFVLFGWCTGMRKGEIASLRWEDLDGDLLTLRGENAKSGDARTIPCEGELSELLARRRERRAVKVGGAVMLCDLIFHRQGNPIREFRKAWRTACRIAVIPGRLFHDLRRSAVRDLVRSGVSQNVAMSISGHRSPSMFERYNITDDRDQRQALQQVQQYRKSRRSETDHERVVAIAGD
jgi:integrase